jgi:radical SAM superfamily enzyme YgiQ (UPF0313 family)
VMTYWYKGAFEAIEQIHDLLPGVPVILGGIYATLCPEHARKESGADSVVTDSLPSQIVEIVERTGGLQGEGAGTTDQFSSWPEPLWELYENLPTAVVMTSRGCPMRCTVCASPLLVPSFERRTPHDSATSIINLASRGVSDIAFTDDALLLNAGDYAIPMLKELAKAGAPVRLHTPNGLHIREITGEAASHMREAGITTIRLSLETTSEERTEDFSSKVSRESFKNAVTALYSAGYVPGDIGAYILAGLPGQTLEEVLDTAHFVNECGVKIRPALFSPVPKTVEFERAIKTGMLTHNDDPLLHNNTLRTVDWFEKGEQGYRNFKKKINEMNRRLSR